MQVDTLHSTADTSTYVVALVEHPAAAVGAITAAVTSSSTLNCTCLKLPLLLLLQWPKVLNAPLAEVDPELYDIIEKEKNRQCKVRQQQQHAMFCFLCWLCVCFS
jgi:hypothetical protein